MKAPPPFRAGTKLSRADSCCFQTGIGGFPRDPGLLFSAAGGFCEVRSGKLAGRFSYRFARIRVRHPKSGEILIEIRRRTDDSFPARSLPARFSTFSGRFSEKCRTEKTNIVTNHENLSEFCRKFMFFHLIIIQSWSIMAARDVGDATHQGTACFPPCPGGHRQTTRDEYRFLTKPVSFSTPN